MNLSSFFKIGALCLLMQFFAIGLHAQLDTMFWFAAPNFSSGHGEQPIYLRFSTINEPADVTISLPANPAFAPLNFTIPAGSSHTENMSIYLPFIENDVPNSVENKGILIESTTLMNAYYENASYFNPEIFSLKGSKSLGMDFVIPMQEVLPNGNYSPVPYSSFDIIATEDNTEVTIEPADDIVGHAAGVSFMVVLNRGETFVCRARSTNRGRHLGGSFVSSNKKIAITIKDDSMDARSLYGGCADLGGDQITPVSILGDYYITIPGALNGPNDGVFIYGVYDNTDVSINGLAAGTVDRGTSIDAYSNGNPIVILTSQPVYVLHMSGFGCEVGLDQMPPIDPCNGSEVLAVNRSSNQPFFLNILVYKGLNGDFLFNGRNDVIQSSDFTVVPGVGGEWFYANLEISLADLPVGGSAIIENTEGPFHLSVIHGGPGTGTMYGFFSDYGETDFFPDLQLSCYSGLLLELDTSYAKYEWSTGDTTNTLKVNFTGLYHVTVTSAHGCVASDSIYVEVLPEARSIHFESICEGDTFEIGGQKFHKNRLNGEIVLFAGASNGCDSILQVNVNLRNTSEYIWDETLCPGDSRIIDDQFFDATRPRDTIISKTLNSVGCDSTIVIDLKFHDPAVGQVAFTTCLEDTIYVAGEAFYLGKTHDTILLPSAATFGCDSSVIVDLDFYPRAVGQVQLTICKSDTAYVDGNAFYKGYERDSIIFSQPSFRGCDSVVFVEIEFFPRAIGQLQLSTCYNDTVFVDGHAFYDGHEMDSILISQPSSLGCDSTLIVQVEIFPKQESQTYIDLCYHDTIDFLGVEFHRGHLGDTIILDGADAHGCDSTVFISVNLFPESVESIKDTLCPDESRVIGGEIFNNLRQSGEVLLQNQNINGCDSLIYVDIFFPQNDLDLQDTFQMNYGSTVELIPWYLNDMASWNWTPPLDLTCFDCERPWTSTLESRRYFLNTIDEFGCPYETETLILVLKDIKIFIPNAITTNDDRLNDGFTVFGNFFAERIEILEIYDRWGELLARIDDIALNDPSIGWDGTFLGEKVSPGVYVYRTRVRFLDGTTEEFAGDVTVVR